MPEQQDKPSLFTYLDKALGDDGIKTSSKFDISIDAETAVTISIIGAGLVVFNHMVGLGFKLLTGSK